VQRLAGWTEAAAIEAILSAPDIQTLFERIAEPTVRGS
jgi:hypothetical protein